MISWGATNELGAPLFAFFAKGGYDAARSAGFDSGEISWRKRHRARPFGRLRAGSCKIVDTTGKGFHLTSAEDGVAFDISGTGHPVKMAWTASDSGDAFLALDRNHNGKIDGGKELFGNYAEQSPCEDGTNSCFNGYRALAEFDKPENGGNGDGIIDSRDAVYSKLLLWIDTNHDGISQPNELHTLPELGVYSIALKYHDGHFRDEYGNWFRYSSALNPDPQDGTSKDGRANYDVFFAYYTGDGSWVPSGSCPNPK